MKKIYYKKLKNVRSCEWSSEKQCWQLSIGGTFQTPSKEIIINLNLEVPLFWLLDLNGEFAMPEDVVEDYETILTEQYGTPRISLT